MNNEPIKDMDICYMQATNKAYDYFKILYDNAIKKTYENILIKDIEVWKQNHIHYNLLYFFQNAKKKSNAEDYHSYIKWLDKTGKLYNYLDRSISYIYMRDLGKTLDAPDTQDKIRSRVNEVKAQLTKSIIKYKGDNKENIIMAKLYREAQREGIESTMIWLINKLKIVSENIPKGMDAEHAQRKLIKIIAGVLMHEVEDMVEDTQKEERTKKVDEAIRLGYAYGLTYPFIDDLLDSKVLSDKEKKQYSDLIRTSLITRIVPDIGTWNGDNKSLIKFIHSELKEAFEYIKTHQSRETIKSFFEQAYVFFKSQEVDREKDLSNVNYTNEEIYIPIILKSASSRLIVRSVLSASEDEEFDNLTFFYGIYNQLADDFTDMFDDMKSEAVTPYTYYLKYYDKRKDLINPFELYFTVISNLIHNVYHSDIKTCEVILDRAVNSFKRYKQRMGIEKYNEVMNIFTLKSSKFNNILQNMVKKADDVDFFDKLIRDHMLNIIKRENNEKEEFLDTIENVRNEINDIITIPKDNNISIIEASIIEAANYSLEGDGKRLRPTITWIMGLTAYGLKKSEIIPLIKSLEYMHTASLIFDDLPSQDSASTRRGRLTLHEVYDVAIAELTGLFLTQKAIYEQTYLEKFDSKIVLKLIRYSTKVTEDMCKGQVLDLKAKGRQLTLEELNTMAFYKTGLAFEAALIMPAILAEVNDTEIKALKNFAHHAGIAFQIKDDLLDVEGDPILLGKQLGKDAENNNSTFVSILGIEEAKKEMWEQYCLAMEALQGVLRNITFLKHLLGYIVNRDH